MTVDVPAGESDSPQRLLADAEGYSRQTRLAQRHTWFPLLVLGLVVAIWPLLGLVGPPGGCGPVVHNGALEYKFCTIAGSSSFFWYWMISLSLAYVVITWFYLSRARRRGVGTRVGRYVWAWLAGLALISISVWLVHEHLDTLTSAGSLPGFRLAAFAPLLAIGLGLFVLAWVERYPALAWFALGYLILGVVLMVSIWPSEPLSHLIGPGAHPRLFAASRYLTIAVFLWLGSAGFGLAERSTT